MLEPLSRLRVPLLQRSRLSLPHGGRFLGLLPLLLLTAMLGLGAQDESDEGEATGPDPAAIEALFKASSATFENGKLTLTYDFKTMNEELAEDWLPPMDKTKNRVRWSRGYEGTWATVEHGVVIADSGQWMHKAHWKDVEMQVDYLSMSSMRKGDLLAATFTYDKGRRSVGSQIGRQCVRLKGFKHSGKPIPATELPVAAVEDRFSFGFHYKDGVIKALRSGSPGPDSSENPKFVNKAGPGMAGLHWKGLVNGFVFQVTLEGTLDPEWLEKQLGSKKE